MAVFRTDGRADWSVYSWRVRCLSPRLLRPWPVAAPVRWRRVACHFRRPRRVWTRRQGAVTRPRRALGSPKHRLPAANRRIPRPYRKRSKLKCLPARAVRNEHPPPLSRWRISKMVSLPRFLSPRLRMLRVPRARHLSAVSTASGAAERRLLLVRARRIRAYARDPSFPRRCDKRSLR